MFVVRHYAVTGCAMHVDRLYSLYINGPELRLPGCLSAGSRRHPRALSRLAIGLTVVAVCMVPISLTLAILPVIQCMCKCAEPLPQVLHNIPATVVCNLS